MNSEVKMDGQMYLDAVLLIDEGERLYDEAKNMPLNMPSFIKDGPPDYGRVAINEIFSKPLTSGYNPPLPALKKLVNSTKSGFFKIDSFKQEFMTAVSEKMQIPTLEYNGIMIFDFSKLDGPEKDLAAEYYRLQISHMEQLEKDDLLDEENKKYLEMMKNELEIYETEKILGRMDTSSATYMEWLNKLNGLKRRNIELDPSLTEEERESQLKQFNEMADKQSELAEEQRKVYLAEKRLTNRKGEPGDWIEYHQPVVDYYNAQINLYELLLKAKPNDPELEKSIAYFNDMIKLEHMYFYEVQNPGDNTYYAQHKQYIETTYGVQMWGSEDEKEYDFMSGWEKFWETTGAYAAGTVIFLGKGAESIVDLAVTGYALITNSDEAYSFAGTDYASLSYDTTMRRWGINSVIAADTKAAAALTADVLWNATIRRVPIELANAKVANKFLSAIANNKEIFGVGLKATTTFTDNIETAYATGATLYEAGLYASAKTIISIVPYAIEKLPIKKMVYLDGYEYEVGSLLEYIAYNASTSEFMTKYGMSVFSMTLSQLVANEIILSEYPEFQNYLMEDFVKDTLGELLGMALEDFIISPLFDEFKGKIQSKIAANDQKIQDIDADLENMNITGGSTYKIPNGKSLVNNINGHNSKELLLEERKFLEKLDGIFKNLDLFNAIAKDFAKKVGGIGAEQVAEGVVAYEQ